MRDRALATGCFDGATWPSSVRGTSHQYSNAVQQGHRVPSRWIVAARVRPQRARCGCTSSPLASIETGFACEGLVGRNTRRFPTTDTTTRRLCCGIGSGEGAMLLARLLVRRCYVRCAECELPCGSLL